MKYQSKRHCFSILLFFFSISFSFTNATTETESACKKAKPIFIKVLLDEFGTQEKTIFNISAQARLYVKLSQQARKTYRLKRPKFQIMVKDNTLFARQSKGPYKKIASNELYFFSSAQKISINGKEYAGMISFTLVPKQMRNNRKPQLFVINKLNLNDYVYSVLSAESYPSWPLDMQKIQAITSRTYAIWQMLDRRRKSSATRRLYDIKRNTFHQRYLGDHAHHHLRQAVDETNDLILTHNNNVALAMFDACCGGCIPAHIDSLDFSRAPYLARKKPCHFCKNYQLYHWKRTIPLSTLSDHLYTYKPIALKLPNKKKYTIDSIKVLERDKAGIVNSVSITWTKKSGKKQYKKSLISGKDLWMSMNNLMRSQNFSLTNHKNDNKISITGNGFGHQIGLCQRGAREMVRQGFPLKKIFEFYYPGTKLARLTLG